LNVPFLFNSIWPGLAVWTVLYISDYTLTLICARLYRSGVNQKIAIEGSFELNPLFQRDIDALRRFSPRFLAMLGFTTLFLWWVWFLSLQSSPAFYAFVLGSWVLLEVVIHVRHLRNLATFRQILNQDFVRGRIEYSRKFTLRVSAFEILTFAGALLVIFAFTQSWFILGGVASCISTSIKHFRLAGRLNSATPVGMQQEVQQVAPIRNRCLT
jgi:hypothetical protein